MPRTELPSIFIACADVPWQDPDYDFTRRGGTREFLEMDPATYDRVCIDPFRQQSSSEVYQLTWASAWNNVNRYDSLWSLQNFLRRARSRSGKLPILYAGGVWGSLEEAYWRDKIRRGTFHRTLLDILQWYMDGSGPLCDLCFDGFGEMQEMKDVSAMIVAQACQWGFKVLVEGFPNQQSCMWKQHSLSTGWNAGRNADVFRGIPAAWAGVLISSTAFTGVPGSEYPRNFVPRWRNAGNAVYIPVHDVISGAYLPYWNATTEDPIQPGGDGGAGGA